jgi:ATP-dependent RNA helicase TDRD9
LSYRVDLQKSRYIGAICGLGTDPHNGHPILPDHDIELPFDVKIEPVDIVKVRCDGHHKEDGRVAKGTVT